MVNGSEIANAETQKTILESLFSEKLKSPISLVRIACHVDEFEVVLVNSHRTLFLKNFHTLLVTYHH
jgi:4-hydroxy 2-oxovalerate aldolase